MADTILVVVEQREGKLNRVSFETIRGAQALAADTGWQVEAAVVGSGASLAEIANEVAKAKLAKVYAIDCPTTEHYTPDSYAAALKQFIEQKQPKLVLMPHTYQVRDFAPKLTTVMNRTLISDAIGYKYEGGKLLFTRQMFQGKFVADVSFTGDAPYFATFQNGAFRSDQVETGSALLENVKIDVAANVVRNKPQEIFKEAKQAVDLTQAEVIVSVGRGIKEQKNLEMVKQLAEALGAEVAASRPICDSGWLPMDRQVGSSGQTVAPKMYLALGISGAIQHIVGMKGSRAIVAINKDAEAPIFEIADYGIVGDLFQVVPPLIEEIKKAKV
jgi:electron transfer flavoprotein alpha subunit